MFLIIGASGNVGREVTRQLLAAGEPVRVLTRNPRGTRFPQGAQVVQGDLARPETLSAAMNGVTRVYSLMRPGTAQHVAAAAANAGVERVVLLTSLAAGESADTPMALAHRTAEAAIDATGIPRTFLRPTSFASNTLAWAASIRAAGKVRAPFGSFRAAVIDPRDIAAVAVAALRSLAHEGMAYPLTGPEPLSAIDEVAIIADVLGRSITFDEQPEDEARAEMLARGMPPQVVQSLLTSQRAALDGEAPVYDTVEQVTGRPAFTYRDWVGAHLAAFA